MRYLLLLVLFSASLASAESRRIEVYPLSQNYWDIKAGDTLGGIVSALLPENRYLQQKLKDEILALNPDVFPDGDPDRMLANRRLWLPNAVRQPEKTLDSSAYHIETYQWGSIKKRHERRGASETN
jgi:Tfp pilus assembly protein FimV